MLGNSYADCHLHLPPAVSAPDFASVLEKAEIGMAFVNAAEKNGWQNVLDAAAQTRAIVPFAGIHPWQLAEHGADDLNDLEALLKENKNLHIGETGLDRAIETPLALQEEFFVRHVELAIKYKRILCVHNVRAYDRIAKILKRAGPLPAGFVLHGFSGPAEAFGEMSGLNGYFSFGARVREKKNAKIRELVAGAPRERILAETDYPCAKNPEPLPPIAAITDALGKILDLNCARTLVYENAGRLVENYGR
ncbi:MAG: TatD family hydrolase [Elusimicrobiaceae bacterium]|jgi:TatD DNase family protein